MGSKHGVFGLHNSIDPAMVVRAGYSKSKPKPRDRGFISWSLSCAVCKSQWACSASCRVITRSKPVGLFTSRECLTRLFLLPTAYHTVSILSFASSSSCAWIRVGHHGLRGLGSEPLNVRARSQMQGSKSKPRHYLSGSS